MCEASGERGGVFRLSGTCGGGGEGGSSCVGGDGGCNTGGAGTTGASGWVTTAGSVGGSMDTTDWIGNLRVGRFPDAARALRETASAAWAFFNDSAANCLAVLACATAAAS
jgi:hypothetical protein